MAGNISEFKASFKTDPARANRFDVYIPVPPTLIQHVNMSQVLSLRCEKAELPGRTFATLDQKIYGPTEKHPYQTTYTDITLDFIVTDEMLEKTFFDSWLNMINPDTHYNFKYKNEYTTPITINQYDATNQKTYSVDLLEAFPISMNQLDLNWSSDDSHKLSVVFAYTTWKNNSIQNVISSAIDTAIGGVVNRITQNENGLLGLFKK